MDDSQPLPPDPSAPASGLSLGTVTSVDPVPVKGSWFWIKDANGNGSVSTTLVTAAFLVTSLAYVLSIVDHVGSVSFRPFDTAAASVYMIPILTMYFGRHYVDSNATTPVKGG